MEIHRKIPKAWLIQDYVSKLAGGDTFTAHDIASTHDLDPTPELTAALNEMKCVEPPQYAYKQRRGHGVRNIYTKLKGKPSCETCPVLKSGRMGCVIKEEAIRKIFEESC